MIIDLSQEKGQIFRISHIDNFEWVIDCGALEARKHASPNPKMRNIGDEELIKKRASREVPIEPFGTLDDYVPFYFTPFSIMFYYLHTGYGGFEVIPNENLIFFIASLPKLQDAGISFVFTDRHALLRHANFFSSVSALGKINWHILRDRDFRNDPNDPEKKEQYQAEALIYKEVPLSLLDGIVCYNELTERYLRERAGNRYDGPILQKREWYF